MKKFYHVGENHEPCLTLKTPKQTVVFSNGHGQGCQLGVAADCGGFLFTGLLVLV